MKPLNSFICLHLLAEYRLCCCSPGAQWCSFHIWLSVLWSTQLQLCPPAAAAELLCPEIASICNQLLVPDTFLNKCFILVSMSQTDTFSNWKKNPPVKWLLTAGDLPLGYFHGLVGSPMFCCSCCAPEKKTQRSPFSSTDCHRSACTADMSWRGPSDSSQTQRTLDHLTLWRGPSHCVDTENIIYKFLNIFNVTEHPHTVYCDVSTLTLIQSHVARMWICVAVEHQMCFLHCPLRPPSL